MPEPVEQIEIAAIGTWVSLANMFIHSEKRADEWATKIAGYGEVVAKSLESSFGAIDAAGEVLVDTLSAVDKAFGKTMRAAEDAAIGMGVTITATEDLGAAARAAAPEIAGIAAAITDVKDANKGVSATLNASARSIEKVGVSATAADGPLASFLALLEKTKAAASTPITQVVQVKPAGAGYRRGGTSIASIIAGEAPFESFGKQAFGSGMLGAGAVTGVGLGVSAFAAASRESSLADVHKVFTDATDDQIKQIDKDLVGLTHTLPYTYAELAKLANFGGQLGVPLTALREFVKTTAELGMATDLTGEKAAEGIAKIGAAFGVADKQFPAFFKDMGNALAAMSKAGSAHTSEILSMSMRFASAAKQARMSVPDILAMSNAVLSMGQQAEAGGSALQRIIGKMQMAVETGKGLENFGKVAGMTGQQFKEAFRKDAYSAITRFVEGLAVLDKQGHSSVVTLTNMGITEVRLRQTILNLSEGFQKATDYRRKANDAIQKGTELESTAAIVAKTTAAQVKIFFSRVQELGNNIGSSLLPRLNSFIESVNKLIDRFNKLDKGTQDSTATVALWATGILLAVGSLVKLGLGIASIGKLLLEMRGAAVLAGAASANAATAGMTAFAAGGGFMLALAGAAAAIGGIVYLYNQWKTAQDQVADSAKTLAAQEVQMTASGEKRAALVARTHVANEITDLNQALEEPKNITLASRVAHGFPGDNEIAGDFLADKGYDTQNDNYRTIDGIKKRIAALEVSRKALDLAAFPSAAVMGPTQFGADQGYGAAHRNLAAVGADGFAKAAVDHAFDDIMTPKNVASCAYFVSEVFKRAGAPIPGGGIGGAKKLMEWAIASGATAHSAANALPGDLIVYHGSKYGKGGSGYHTAMSLGGGMMRESSGDGPGNIRTVPVYDLKHAQAYTVPGSTFTNAAAVTTATSNIHSLPVSAPPKGLLSRVPYYDMPDPAIVERMLGKKSSHGAGLDAERTGLSNYDLKLGESKERQAKGEHEIELAVLRSGDAMDSTEIKARRYAVALTALHEKVTLAADAIAHAKEDEKKHGDESERLLAIYRGKVKAFKEYRDELSKRAKTTKITQAEGEELRRRAQDVKAIEHQAAIEADLKSRNAALVTKAQADQETAVATILGIETNITKEKEAQAKAADKYTASLESQARHLTAKTDFDQRRIDLADWHAEQAEMIKGLPKDKQSDATAALATLWNNKNDKIREDEAKDARKSQDRLREYLLDSNQLTLADYRDYLLRRFNEQKIADGKMSEEAQQYGAKWLSINAQMTAGVETQLKESLQKGHISIQEYILDLKDLQKTVPVASEAYKGLQTAIDETTKSMDDHMKAQADSIGTKFASVFGQILQHSKGVKEILRETLKEAALNGIEQFTKDSVAKIALRLEKRHADDKMKEAVDAHALVVDKFRATIDNLQAGFNQFQATSDKLVAALTGGVSITGAAGVSGAFGSSGGDGGFGTTKSTSSTGTVDAHANKLTSTANSITNAANTIQSVASLKSGTGNGINAVPTALGAVDKLASLTKWNQVLPSLGEVMPVIGAITAVAGLFALFDNHKPDYVTKTTQGAFSQYLNGDHTGLIDSGYSGSGGMRRLQMQNDASKAMQPQIVNNHSHSNSIVIQVSGVTDPASTGQVVAEHVMGQLDERERYANALTGQSTMGGLG